MITMIMIMMIMIVMIYLKFQTLLILPFPFVTISGNQYSLFCLWYISFYPWRIYIQNKMKVLNDWNHLEVFISNVSGGSQDAESKQFSERQRTSDCSRRNRLPSRRRVRQNTGQEHCFIEIKTKNQLATRAVFFNPEVPPKYFWVPPNIEISIRFWEKVSFLSFFGLIL